MNGPFGTDPGDGTWWTTYMEALQGRSTCATTPVSSSSFPRATDLTRESKPRSVVSKAALLPLLRSPIHPTAT